MGTKTLSAVSLAIGTVALVLAIVALVTMPEGAGDVRREVAGLGTRLGKLGEDVARASSAANETPMKLAKLSARAASLESRVASLANRPAAEPAGRAEVDAERGEEKLRELVREEMQAQARTMMQRVRVAGGGRRGRGVTAESLREDLGLDEEKAASVVELRRKVSEGIRNIWQNRGGDRAKNVELMNELRRKTDEEIAKLLTPEQLEKYKALSDRDRGRRRGRGRDRRGDGGGQPEGNPGGATLF